MNTLSPPTSERTAMVLSRRVLVRGLCAATAVVSAGYARNADAALGAVTVPCHAVGAIVHAITAMPIEVGSDLEPHQIRWGATTASIGQRIMLKGHTPAAKLRFLDDARNAPKLGANIRDALSKVDPERADFFAAQQAKWARPFAKQVIAWSQRLRHSPVRGKTVRDDHGRAALLEWAGAKVDPAAKASAPPSLAHLPAEPAAPTLAAYKKYIQQLVAAVS